MAISNKRKIEEISDDDCEFFSYNDEDEEEISL